MAHPLYPSTQGVDVDIAQWDKDQPGRQSEFQDSKVYTEKHCWRKEKKRIKERTNKQKQCKLLDIAFEEQMDLLDTTDLTDVALI